MARVKGVLATLSGSVGDVMFVHKNNKTYAVQKYDHTDARTKRQVVQRCSICNVANTYYYLGEQLKKDVQVKEATQSYYNMFNSMNLKTGATRVYLSKEDANAKACIVAPYNLTKGSLLTIGAEYVNGVYKSGIALKDFTLSETTKVSEFTFHVINCSRNRVHKFKQGDKIVFFHLKQRVKDGIPYAFPEFDGVTLDMTDDRLLWEVICPDGFQNVDGYLGTVSDLEEGGCAWIHISEDKQGSYISSEKMCCNNSLLASYTSEQAFEKAARSYGGYNVILLSADGTDVSTERDDDDSGNTYLLTVRSVDESKGVVSGGGRYEEGASPTFTAQAVEGNQFTGWFVDGNQLTTDNPGTLTMPAHNVTVEARFEAAGLILIVKVHDGQTQMGKIKINGGEGKTEDSISVASGTQVTVQAVPTPGGEYHFVGWNDGNSDLQRTVTVTESKTLVASFEPEE